MRKSTYILLMVPLGLLACNTKEHEDKKPVKQEITEERKAWNEEDRKAVKAAILDYVEGIYEVDATRIEKSIDSTLRKVGYWYHPKEKVYRDNLPMTYAQLVRLAANWNKDGSQANENSPKEIVIFDISSKTASAKLTAEWGIDYFHLGKYNDQWKIMNVIWQSFPKSED